MLLFKIIIFLIFRGSIRRERLAEFFYGYIFPPIRFKMRRVWNGETSLVDVVVWFWLGWLYLKGGYCCLLLKKLRLNHNVFVGWFVCKCVCECWMLLFALARFFTFCLSVFWRLACKFHWIFIYIAFRKFYNLFLL